MPQRGQHERESERLRLDPFVIAGGDASPRDQRDLMERPFFSLSKVKRVAPILYEAGGQRVEIHGLAEHGMATIWDADVLIWAASQIVEAENGGLRTSRFLRFTPYQLLTAVGRATGARDYRLLKAAFARLQSTVIRTTIRNGEHWRRHQFSWINEWEERTTRDGRVEGMECVLPDWFYRGVIDRSLVLTIDPAYFRLTGGIERWLYRVARKHAGHQKQGWLFEIAHLHENPAAWRVSQISRSTCGASPPASRSPAIASRSGAKDGGNCCIFVPSIYPQCLWMTVWMDTGFRAQGLSGLRAHHYRDFRRTNPS